MTMRVEEESYKGVSEGDLVPLEELGLPVHPDKGLMIVFWKGQ
jgi:hypothetical protein